MTLSPRAVRVLLAGVLLSVGAFALAACESSGEVDSTELEGAPEQGGEELTGTVTVGATVRTIDNVNLRTGASTSTKAIRVIPKGSQITIVKGTPTAGFYNVKHNGTSGWVYGPYITLVDEGDGDGDEGTENPSTDDPAPTPTTSSRDAAILRAKSGVGFSYWWGHGRWRPEGVTSSTRGTCSGNCGSCSHKGSYGADCSGFVAKVWQVPSSNNNVTVDDHPYGTADFSKSTSQWSIVSRDSLKKADALVYRSGGSGHIVVYNSGDAWGAMNAYECKSCSAGCVYNLRSLSSSYKGLRRKGW